MWLVVHSADEKYLAHVRRKAEAGEKKCCNVPEGAMREQLLLKMHRARGKVSVTCKVLFNAEGRP
jgi:hypothetical protein